MTFGLDLLNASVMSGSELFSEKVYFSRLSTFSVFSPLPETLIVEIKNLFLNDNNSSNDK